MLSSGLRGSWVPHPFGFKRVRFFRSQSRSFRLVSTAADGTRPRHDSKPFDGVELTPENQSNVQRPTYFEWDPKPSAWDNFLMPPTSSRRAWFVLLSAV